MPSNYKQQLYTSWSNLRQGTKSVATQESERLTVLCEIDEPEDLKIGRFLRGLKEDLREKVKVIQNLTYEGTCNSALIFEKSAKRRSNQPTYMFNRNKDLSHKPPIQTTSINKVTYNTLPTTSKEKETNLKDIMCFKCRGHGHYKRNCPNARAFT